MPMGQINNLLEIIAAMNAMTGGEGPFKTHKDLYNTINVMNLGDAPWNHFHLNYQGKTNASSPPWQTEDFLVWFWDPLTLIHNLISNLDFDGGFDYLPFQEHDTENNHRYKNFMFGNWSWKQVVCLIIVFCVQPFPRHILLQSDFQTAITHSILDGFP